VKSEELRPILRVVSVASLQGPWKKREISIAPVMRRIKKPKASAKSIGKYTVDKHAFNMRTESSPRSKYGFHTKRRNVATRDMSPKALTVKNPSA
jgi:hypothetical protein